MTIIYTLTNSYSRRRFACLFFSLLITMVAAPVFGAMGLSTRFMEAFVTLNILVTVLITMFRFGNYASLGFLVLILAARAGHAFWGYEPLLSTSHGGCAVVCLIAMLAMLRFILSEGYVTSERIFAALDVYLLIGIMCGLLFCVLEEQWPGSISFPDSSFVGGKRDTLAHAIYFSFVTLGTLGYGDITPVSGPVRALAVSEAIVGQMYLVVVVARLVGLYKGKSEREERGGEGNETNPPSADPGS